MKTHLVHKFLILRMQEFYFCGGRVSAEGKPARDRTKILTDSARNRSRKEDLANYNQTRINICHQHDCWVELKEALTYQTHAEVANKLPLRM